jgi:hypothetical protein
MRTAGKSRPFFFEGPQDQSRLLLAGLVLSPESPEAIAPDTDHIYAVEQMAQAWLTITGPLTQDNAALSVDPDDYPLF